jgi:ligand-binding SRPBCC domain-containing protein
MATTLNETTATIDAAPEVVWSILVDVESWPSLTESMTSVERLDAGPLQVGSKVRIRQPKLPPATWNVTEVVDTERFVWTARGPGFRSTAYHEITAVDGGKTQLRLAVEQAGPLAGLVGGLGKDLTDRYIALEAAGVKRRAEEVA